ncbi:MAG: Holliday junction branch migration protein RuvA [Calditrichia bacterium]
MIERISGQIIEKTPSFCVLDCHGLGVGVHISLNSFQIIERGGDAVQLFTHLHVREDILQLYGFADLAEREIFRLLITISGVGPKLALAILSGGNSDDLRNAIANENVAMLTRIPGVGKKTAQRLILELKEKIYTQGATELLGKTGTASGQPVAAPGGIAYEALQALLALGFKDADARRKVDAVIKAAPEELTLQELVKRALKVA